MVEKIAFPIAKRFIAGESLEDAIKCAKFSNSRGLAAIVNLLGEYTDDRLEIERAAQEYETILQRMHDEKIQGSISVKPTQIGLAVDVGLAKDKMKPVISEARLRKVFLWLDMEGSPYTDSTIELYTWLRSNYPDSGVAVQANLKRTPDDLKRIVSMKGIVRLCKGAYAETTQTAWRRKSDIDRSFAELMDYLFTHAERFAVATHDDKLIRKAKDDAKPGGAEFEFQMLMGIRDDMKIELAKEGYRVSEYIPYGKAWLPYSIRRLRERRRNVLLMFRALFS